MEQHPEKKPFGKREWIFLIVVLVLGQLIVHMIAWRFGANVNALGYISFAGTIVSIILAVLAIIYGFVHTGEQSRASSTIASQVTNLHRVVESFQKSGGALSEQLQQLGDISAGITRAVALGEKSQEQIGKMQSTVDDMKGLVAGSATFIKDAESQTSASLPKTPSSLLKQDIMAAYLSEMREIPAIIVFGIMVANKKGEHDLKTICQKFFVDIYAQAALPLDKRSSRVFSAFLQGYFAGVVRALPQYVLQDKHDISVANEFALALRKILENAKLKDDQGKVLDRLKELDREPPRSPAPAAPAITAT